MSTQTKFTEGDWFVSTKPEMNVITIAKLTNDLCIASTSYVCEDALSDAYILAQAKNMYKELENLLGVFYSESLSVTSLDVDRIEKLLAQARGE